MLQVPDRRHLASAACYSCQQGAPYYKKHTSLTIGARGSWLSAGFRRPVVLQEIYCAEKICGHM